LTLVPIELKLEIFKNHFSFTTTYWSSTDLFWIKH